MNVKNLSIGQIVKNYKEMCKLLCENNKTGNSKKSQISNWERYFKYHKDGNKFVIDEIYDKPKEIEENRGGARRILPHAVRMERILMYLLNQEQKDGELFLPINSLLKEMNMISQNYGFGNRNIKKVSKFLNIEEANVEEFFDYSKRTFKHNIETMLNRLRNKSLIHWNKVMTVCVANVHTIKNELNDIKVNMKVVLDEYDNEESLLSVGNISTYTEYRPATNEEIELILEIEGEVLDKLKCIDKQELIIKGKWNEFSKEVNKKLFDKANIIFYYDSYKIIRNKERLDKEVNDNIDEWIKDEMEFTFEMFSINRDVQGQILTNYESRRKNAFIKNDEEDVVKDKIKMRIGDEYLNHGATMIDCFINVFHKDIRDDIKKIKFH